MKVLFIRSGCACSLPFAENFFRRKLQDAQLTDIEVETADMALWGIESKDARLETTTLPDGTGKLLSQADLVVVLEEKQRNLLSRFMDYACWNKIHLLTDFCRNRKQERMQEGFVDYSAQTPHEAVNDGCSGLVEYVRAFLKKCMKDKDEVQPAVAL